MAKTNKRTLTVFASDIAEVSHAHLLELILTLASYKDALVVVGGWVPYLLLKRYQKPDNDFSHIGSQDIDLAIDPKLIDGSRYRSLTELLFHRGYESKHDRKGQEIPFAFQKNVRTSAGQMQVEVDFLGPEYGGTSQSHRHQIVQGNFLLRKARGCEIALAHRVLLPVSGSLPNGADAEVEIPVADIVGIITMKGIAIGSRYKEKDAYDLVSLLDHYKDGFSSVAAAVKPHLENGLVNEAIRNIAQKFRRAQAEGPSWVADFYGLTDTLEREQLQNHAFFLVQNFLKALES